MQLSRLRADVSTVMHSGIVFEKESVIVSKIDHWLPREPFTARRVGLTRDLPSRFVGTLIGMKSTMHRAAKQMTTRYCSKI